MRSSATAAEYQKFTLKRSIEFGSSSPEVISQSHKEQLVHERRPNKIPTYEYRRTREYKHLCKKVNLLRKVTHKKDLSHRSSPTLPNVTIAEVTI